MHMNPFNKVEAIGIFLSIAVMAIALGVLRFNSDVFTLNTQSESQGAVVVVSQTDEKSDSELEQALVDASTSKGELVDLVIDDVRVGSGEGVKKGDTLSVHYIGTTPAGVRFDSSYERGAPYEFTVGEGKVIAGWEQGVIGMKVGGQRILVIPSELAYGNRRVGQIEPNSTLVFSVELISVK